MKKYFYQLIKSAFPVGYDYYLAYKKNKYLSKLENILSRSAAHSYYDDEDLYTHLQNAYNGVPEYGYDSFSTWKRGVERAIQLVGLNGIEEKSRDILEAGCGDGMTAHALNSYGHNVILLDQDDWREPRAKSLSFNKVDLNQPLEFNADTFDLVYSFNTFEHLPNPDFTLKELMRVCKPGGYIFLEFGPLYASPWGLHAYRMLKMPYSQFLFSKQFIKDKLEQMGVNDLGQKLSDLQYVNGWYFGQYDELFNKYSDNIIEYKVSDIPDHLNMVIDYPDAFSGIGLSLKDLRSGSIKVFFKK